MNDKLINDIKKSKHVKIVGVSALATNELRSILENALFDELEKGNKECIIIAESDNQLFQQSLLTDNVNASKRISFEELTIMQKFFFNEFSRTEGRLKKTSIYVSALMLPLYAIQTDDNLWYMPINTFNAENYIVIKDGDSQFNIIKDYMDSLDGDLAKFLSKPGKELLELFDQNKVPRGIFPRDSFYNTDHYQYVVWGLVFNREGKLLIHKRAQNAKDNQGMWDKSVGGHLDFTKEKSTQDGMVRELIEELFTSEKTQQSGHGFSMLTDDKNSVYPLGDWRLENHGPYYLDHLKLLESKKAEGEENWVIYKYPETFTHNTPRELPDGKFRRLRVMVDVFFIITNTSVTDDYVQGFENSTFLLIEPNKLKSWVDSEQDDNGKMFKATPGLKFIMTGRLRDIISEVSTTIKFSNIRK